MRNPERRCRWCSQPFIARRFDQSCCSSACNGRIENLEMARAKTLYRALYWWRYDRKRGVADNLRFICRSIAAWIEEDKLSQRQPPPRHRHDMDRGYIRRPLPTMSPRGRKAA